MEETMRVLTINELLHMTRTELCGLAARITAALPTLREGLPAISCKTPARGRLLSSA
jgi:hypothetical protein